LRWSITRQVEAYSKVDEVQPGLRFGNNGASGWSCIFWSDQLHDEAPHRPFLEAFGQEYPEAALKLPPYDRDEDFVSGSLRWAGSDVEVYYKTILSHLALWSEDRRAVEGAREALMNGAV
jgi:hypothetical protein